MTSVLPFEIVVNIAILIFYAVFWGIVFITLYHLTRFGIGTQPKKLAAALLFGAVILFCGSVFAFATLDLGVLLP